VCSLSPENAYGGTHTHTQKKKTNRIASGKRFGSPTSQSRLGPQRLSPVCRVERSFGGRAKRFENDEALQTAHQDLATGDVYEAGIQKLIPRYLKRIELDGDYVEK